jgi:putative DNA primase/helicase
LTQISSPIKDLKSLAIGLGAGDLGAVNQQAIEWDRLTTLLSSPKDASIGHAEYLSLPKAERNELKKRDRFMLLGTCRDGKRDDKHLESRSAATIDVDEDADVLFGALSLIGAADVPFAHIWHTTRSHTDAAPRLRIIVPFSRDVSPAEYRRLLPALGAMFGTSYDPASVKPAQMMFLPVRNSGAPFDSGESFGAGFIDPDTLLVAAPASEPDKPADSPKPDADDLEQLVFDNPAAEKVAEISSALMYLAPRETGYERWAGRAQNLKHLGEIGFGLWCAYSRAMPDYDPAADHRAKWDKDIKGDRSDYRAIFTAAYAAGWTKPGVGDADYATKVDRTDTGNANLLIRLTASDLRYVADFRLWLQWDGEKWQADPHGANAQASTKRVAEHYALEAAKLEREAKNPMLADSEAKQVVNAAKSVRAWEAKCRSRSGIDNMLALARLAPGVLLGAADLDTDAFLFGVANGVVDLRTSALRPASRDDFVTKRSPVRFVPGATCPRWVQFIEEITATPIRATVGDDGAIDRATVGRYAPRPALAAYVKRMLGYLLTGLTREQKLFVLTGPGSNGKSVLLDVLQALMADYARTVPTEFLMTSKQHQSADSASPVLAGLVGVRLALSSESKEGHRFDTGHIKNLTGDSRATARKLHANPFEFTVTHKHVLLANTRPDIEHLDAAIKGRLHLVPFDRRWNRPDEADCDPLLPDGDKLLMPALRAESEGILTWLIAGAGEYLKDGLAAPDEVTGTTRDYFMTQDPLGRWLTGFDRCDPKAGTRGAELFSDFESWCLEENERAAGLDNQTAFSNALKARSVIGAKRKDGNYWGIRARAQETASSRFEDSDLA